MIKGDFQRHLSNRSYFFLHCFTTSLRTCHSSRIEYALIYPDLHKTWNHEDSGKTSFSNCSFAAVTYLGPLNFMLLTYHGFHGWWCCYVLVTQPMCLFIFRWFNGVVRVALYGGSSWSGTPDAWIVDFILNVFSVHSLYICSSLQL